MTIRINRFIWTPQWVYTPTFQCEINDWNKSCCERKSLLRGTLVKFFCFKGFMFLCRFMGLEPATCAWWLAWCRWLKKAVWDHCGEEMAWMSSKLLLSRPWNLWHMSRYEEWRVCKYIKYWIWALSSHWHVSISQPRLSVWSAGTKKLWASWSGSLPGPWLASLLRAQSTPWRWVGVPFIIKLTLGLRV